MQIFEHSETIRTHEADAFGRCRPDALFRMMQEVAGEHSAHLGISRADLLERFNAVWMIARVQLVIDRVPQLYDTLHIKTWYGVAERITYPRYLELYDDQGARVAAFAASWVVADIEERRILPPGKVHLPFPPPAELAPPLPEPGRIRIKQAGAAETHFRAPQYSDVDVNGHMNNASYVTWILDLFPVSYHSTHRIQSLMVGYSAEAKAGELVEMTLYRDGDAFEIIGIDKTDKRTIFEAQGAFTAI